MTGKDENGKTRLTEKQEAFAQYSVMGKCATEAAKLAGYSQKTAYSSGYNLWNNAGIKLRIAELRGGQLAKVEKSLEKQEKKAQLTIDKALDDVRWGIETSRERKQLAAHARYTELECRILGMLTDRTELIVPEQQQRLNEAERAECLEIARIRLGTVFTGPTEAELAVIDVEPQFEGTIDVQGQTEAEGGQ